MTINKFQFVEINIISVKNSRELETLPFIKLTTHSLE